jgi:hypothetical protein
MAVNALAAANVDKSTMRSMDHLGLAKLNLLLTHSLIFKPTFRGS